MLRTYNPITLGELKEAFLDESSAEFEWTFPDCSKDEFGFYRSPTVEYFKVCWNLEIGVSNWSLDVVTLNGKVVTRGILEFFLCTIRWKKSDGFERVIVRDETVFAICKTWNAVITRLSGRVTFTCTLRRYLPPLARGLSHETRTKGASCSNGRKEEHVNPGLRGVSRETQTEDTGFKGVSRETQTEDAPGRKDERPLEDTSSLSDHLKNLLLSGDGHDVLIKVEEKQFRAHKHILKARSPVFAAMFTNDMAESAEDSVTIEDCNPDAFGDFLQFVYTGKVDIASVGSALGLYHAGDKYDFPRLKEMCVVFLRNSFTTATIFDVASLAATHDEEELLQQAISYLSKHLEEVMVTVEWQRFITANPIQANEMCLRALQCREH